MTHSPPPTPSMEPVWTEVDDYFTQHLLPGDDALNAALSESAAEGLPPISVTPPQGKLLHLLARACRARRILEIGTLGGYSTIWLARAIPAGGHVVTLEIDTHHADVARRNIERAGLADRIDLRLGRAADTLNAISPKVPNRSISCSWMPTRRAATSTSTPHCGSRTRALSSSWTTWCATARLPTRRARTPT